MTHTFQECSHSPGSWLSVAPTCTDILWNSYQIFCFAGPVVGVPLSLMPPAYPKMRILHDFHPNNSDIYLTASNVIRGKQKYATLCNSHVRFDKIT